MTIRPNQKKNLILLKPVFFSQKASLILYILSDRIRLLPYENKLSDKEAVLTFVDDSVSIVVVPGRPIIPPLPVRALKQALTPDTTAGVCGHFAA